jgi:RNA polymerase sigma-70 factor (ECF subfamily)
MSHPLPCSFPLTATPGHPPANPAPDAGASTVSPALQAAAADRRLLARVAGREPDALAALFDRHAAAVLGLLTRMLGRHGEAEEVLQEVFLWVWQNPLRYDPARSGLRGWLLVLARSRALDVLRASRSRRLREVGVAQERPASFEPVPLEALEERERRRRIAAALGCLPAEQRRCIELAFFGGLSHSQVAARLCQPLGTVKSRIQLGMAKLRVALGGEGGAAAATTMAS